MTATPPDPTIPPPRLTRARRDRTSGAAWQAQLVQDMPVVWVTHALAAINLVVFAAMVASGVSPLSPSSADLLRWGADYGPLTLGGEWWRLLTNAFVHLGMLHLGLNLWCLWTIGGRLERIVGHRAFLIIYVFAAVAGSLTSIGWAPEIVSAGASGAIFGSFGALYACAHILRSTVPSGLFENLRAQVVVFLGYNLVYGLRQAGLDQAAHVGGLAAGFLAATLLCRLHRDRTQRQPPLWIDLRRLPALFVLLALGAITAHWRVGTSDVGQLLALDELRERAVAAERYDEALACVDKMITIAPGQAQWHGERGLYLGNLGRAPEALLATDRALALDDSDAMLHSNRAWLLAMLERHEESVPAARRALAIDPQLLLAHHNLLASLDALDRPDEYLRAAKAALGVDDRNVATLVHLCCALGKLGRYDEALATADAALAIEPTHALATEHRDWLRAQLGKAK